MSNGVNKGGGGCNGNSGPNVPVYVNIYDMVTETFNTSTFSPFISI